jgi:hypothetical protein
LLGYQKQLMGGIARSLSELDARGKPALPGDGLDTFPRPPRTTKAPGTAHGRHAEVFPHVYQHGRKTQCAGEAGGY